MKTALVLTCDDNFIPYTSVVARRIALGASEKFPIVIVSDGVSDENKALARKFCPRITFIEGSGLFDSRSFHVHANFSRACYLRLFFDEILADFDRIAYIDSDVSPLTDISPMMQMKPKAAPVIAAYDMPILESGNYMDRIPLSPGSAYFNSGVMVFDMNASRSEGIFADALRFALEHPKLCTFVDQDALNVAIDGRWQVLDWRWNALTFMLDHLPSRPFIRHITGEKPWTPHKDHIEPYLVEQWRADLAESPWPDRWQARAPRTAGDRLRPALASVENCLKGIFYSKSNTRRGRKIRFKHRFRSILTASEQAASMEQLAVRDPEAAFLSS